MNDEIVINTQGQCCCGDAGLHRMSNIFFWAKARPWAKYFSDDKLGSKYAEHICFQVREVQR